MSPALTGGSLTTSSTWEAQSEWLSSKGTQITNSGKWGCKLVQSLWKTVRRLLKNPKTELPHDPAIPIWVYIQKNQKHQFKKMPEPQRSQQHYKFTYNSQDTEAT